MHRQLPRILASSDFVASERHRRFLRHVVERTLRGETATGHEIGTLVFGRPSSFNATTDPIVLIEAGKLPCDFETYYLKSGQHDALRISMPRGAYRAVSTRNDAQVAGVLCALRAGSPPSHPFLRCCAETLSRPNVLHRCGEASRWGRGFRESWARSLAETRLFIAV